MQRRFCLLAAVFILLTGVALRAENAAVENLETAWKANPASSTVCLRLAQAYLELDRWPDMLRILGPIQNKDPKNPDVLYLLSLAHVNLGHASEARSHQRAVQALDPARGKELRRLLEVFETLAGLEESPGTPLPASGVDPRLIQGILGDDPGASVATPASRP